MKRKQLEKGDTVEFVTGNFSGLTGVVIKTDFHSNHKNAIYGYYHEVLLSDGRTGFIEKSEHWIYASK